MITHTKTLFSSILKTLEADCVCDIGSRDGDQALLFRHLRPEAVVLAFEANPLNFQAMLAKSALQEARIEVLPYAISSETGQATFHITEADYSNPEENIGTSSLLVHEGLKIKQSVAVEVWRIDDFILKYHPSVKKIGLWIDAEGAEFAIMEGMSGISERILALHVETAKVPLRVGQRTYADVLPLMEKLGFAPCGSNIGNDATWGDVVFVSNAARDMLGSRFLLCQLRGLAGQWLSADRWAVFLKSHFPKIYHLLRRIYIRVGM